jgi:hypothetical protein
MFHHRYANQLLGRAYCSPRLLTHTVFHIRSDCVNFSAALIHHRINVRLVQAWDKWPA